MLFDERGIQLAAMIDDYAASRYLNLGTYKPIGQQVVTMWRAARIGGPLAAGICEWESGFRNVFGWDWGRYQVDKVPFARLPVTAERVAALLAAIEKHDFSWSNGVGVTQITYPPLLWRAEQMGGAHLTEVQLLVGFEQLRKNLDAADSWLAAVGAYNSGSVTRPNLDYAEGVAELAELWKERFAAV